MLIGLAFSPITPEAWVYCAFFLVATNVAGAAGRLLWDRLQRESFLNAQLALELANTDSVTGIMNRRAFIDHLQLLWPQARRSECMLTLLLVDIDHFKSINGRAGHAGGGDNTHEMAARRNQTTISELDDSDSKTRLKVRP